MQQIQWYPGHMTKARRAMQEDIKLVDMVIELVDARAPEASRNPDIDQMAQGKSRVLILNKADLADESVNLAWVRHYESQGYFVMMLDSRSRASAKKVSALIAAAGKEKQERDRKRGILNRPIRAMVAGIPNVGKSTFINTIAGRAAAKTGNKPGVTRGNQWIRLGKNIELLDTPGILWPKFEDQSVGQKLSMIGSVKDDILNMTDLAYELMMFLHSFYEGILEERYGLTGEDCTDIPGTAGVLDEIALNRHCLAKGGNPDADRAALLLFDDFRSGRLGRLSLEFPPEKKAS